VLKELPRAKNDLSMHKKVRTIQCRVNRLP
jgi:hypothetical protein